MNAVKVGMVLKDNDPRCNHRRLTVVRVDERYAYCDGAGPNVRIMLSRIFTDGKARRYGFNTAGEGEKG